MYSYKGLARASAAVALLGLLLVVGSPASAEQIRSQLLAETDALASAMGDGDLRIVDVRSREAYDKGHLPNAVHLDAEEVIDPMSHVEGALLPQEQLAAMLGARGIDRDTRVVLYDDNGGFHASRLFWMLESFGHRRVSVLNGGFPKWLAERREVSTVEPQVPAKRFVVTVTERRIATADWLLERRDDPSVVVIDVRPEKLFAAGHIPWARNIPWKHNLSDDQTMKSADALLAHFAAQGVTPDKSIAVHCQQGIAAGHTYFTLRWLGFPQVRSYDRSWAEWGLADDLPKAVGSPS